MKVCGVRQTGPPWVIEDRCQAWVAAPFSEQSPNSIRGRTSSLLASCQKEPSILPTAPMEFPGEPERLAATAACASPPPRPRFRVSRAGAGSDRNDATRHRPGSPSRHRGTGPCGLRPFRRELLSDPSCGRCPGTRAPSPTREVRALLSHRPSSGRKATRVAAVSGPTPGTVRSLPAGPSERCPATLPGTYSFSS